MKGICFIEPLHHKVVRGEKTMTRRIMPQQPLDGRAWKLSKLLETTDPERKKHEGKLFWELRDDAGRIVAHDDRHFLPRYGVGEALYLKEPYDRSYIPEIGDKYDNPFQAVCEQKCWETIYKYDGVYAGAEWKNKLFMPEKYARHFIEMLSVRAERLQEISDEDCMKEGIEKALGMYCYDWIEKNGRKLKRYCVSPQLAYASLIDSINGKGTWERNQYVWVYENKLINK
jgi:hypothetical protein